MRTRECVLIARAICWRCENVELCFHLDPSLEAIQYPDRKAGEVQCDVDLDGFAQRDGFPHWRALRAFWRLNHPKPFALMRERRAGDEANFDHRGRIFCGVIITWGPLLARGPHFDI